MSEKKWTLVLNKYQRDNLLWLINACGWPGGNCVEPFHFASTGDWIGEIGWMLKDDEQAMPQITQEDRPNRSFDELFELVETWRDD